MEVAEAHTLATRRDLPAAAAELAAAPWVAVDTEFHAERRYWPRLLLVQVHVPGGRTWILDPLMEGVLEGVGAALRTPTWIVHAGHQDVRLLHHALGGLPDRVMDTQIAAALIGTRFPASFGDLVAEHVGVVLDKGATMSDWTRRPLSPEQLAYAATDAHLLRPLWEDLERRLRDAGRLEHCRSASAELVDRAIAEPDPWGMWRRIQAHPYLHGAELLVLQELVAWREQEARRRDQPARSIVSDGVLVDLSRRRPLTLEAMRLNRRFPRSLASRHGEALLEHIARAAERPPDAVPAVVRPGTSEDRRAAWLVLMAQTLGTREGFAQRLVLPRVRAEDLVTTPGAQDRAGTAALLGPWRDDLCGDAVHGAVQGDVALRLADRDIRLEQDGQ